MICKLCERDLDCQGHHLVPKMVSKRSIMRKAAERDIKDTDPLCIPCHRQMHKLFTEKELGLKYNTIEKLLQHPSVQKWVKWIKTKPVDFIPPT